MATATAKAGLKKQELEAPHVVRVAKGQAPEYITLSSWQQFCWRFMGSYAKGRVVKFPKLESLLLKAHMKVRPEEFLAEVYTGFFIAVILGIVLAVVIAGVMTLVN